MTVKFVLTPVATWLAGWRFWAESLI